MFKRIILLFNIVIFCLLCVSCQEKKTAPQPSLKIGYMICNSLPETKARFEPLTAYLQEKLGRPVESVYLNTEEVEDAVRQKALDFTHTNSILYVIFKERYKATVVAGEARGRYGNRDAGTIIARKGSGINTIQDVKGKSMVFGPALAPLGYLAQYDLMLKNNINPEEDLAFYNIPWGSFKHEKAIYAVLYGAYDLGSAPRLDLDQMAAEGRINLDDLTIVAESEPIAYCTMAAMAWVDPQVVEQVKNIMANITQEESVLVNGEVLKILKSALVERFVTVDDSEYDSLRQMLKHCQMAPYEEY